MTMSDDAGNALIEGDNIAPAPHLAANLFASAELLLNGVVVSRISNNIPQVEALKSRLKMSKSSLDSLCAETNFCQPSYQERQMQVCSNGLDSVKYHYYAPTAAAGTGTTLQFLDLLTPNQVQFTAANLIIFTANGGAAIPDLRNYFSVGDSVAFNDGAEKVRTITLVEAAQLTVDGAALTAPAVANLVAQVRQILPALDVSKSKSRRVKEFELIWKPPLSLFDYEKALPSGDWEIRLNPQPASSYREYCIESTGATKSAGAGNDFLVSVDEMFFYSAEVEGKRLDDITYLIDLEESRCTSKICTASNNLQQHEFAVSPSTFALSVAWQDNAVESDTRYPMARFKIGGEGTDSELSLTRLYVQYDSRTGPSPDILPEYSADSKDFLVEMYYRNLLDSGAIADTGGVETLKDWQDRGIYLHQLWPRDGTSRSTRCMVNFESAFDGLTAPRVLLFDHYRKAVRVRHEGGRVVDVQVEEV
jgi:hypothetical protein